MEKVILGVILVLVMGFLGCVKEATAPYSPPQGKVVAMKDNYLDPSSLTISVGDTVVWVNRGSIAHTSTSGQGCTADGKWNSGYLAPGQSFTKVFQEAGTYPYFCIPHCSGGMRGTMVVNP